MSYSIDLRTKALEYYSECKNITQTCKTFKMARSTLYSWIKLREEKGNVNSKVRTEYKMKMDYEQLKEFVKERPDAFLREYAQHFNVTIVGIWKALNKLKITRKKRPQPIKKPILKNKENLKNRLKI